MHELSICRALVARLEAIAREHAARVSEVHVSIGPLSGVEARLLRDAFPLACAGTAAEGAALKIETAPVRVRCRVCGAETVATPNRLLCAACGEWRTDLLSGDEMLLRRAILAIDDDPPMRENVREPSHV